MKTDCVDSSEIYCEGMRIFRGWARESIKERDAPMDRCLFSSGLSVCLSVRHGTGRSPRGILTRRQRDPFFIAERERRPETR